jgi:hypothetical protein
MRTHFERRGQGPGARDQGKKKKFSVFSVQFSEMDF